MSAMSSSASTFSKRGSCESEPWEGGARPAPSPRLSAASRVQVGGGSISPLPDPLGRGALPTGSSCSRECCGARLAGLPALAFVGPQPGLQGGKEPWQVFEGAPQQV